jgi:hypothetical protein
MRTCSRCDQVKIETEFFFKDKKTGRRHSQCKDCYRANRGAHYAEHYAKYKTLYRERARKRRNVLKKEFRENMLAYLHGKTCEICGETDIRTFEFDHIDQTKKTFAVSQAVRLGYMWPEVTAELQKCRILCANCHKKHTASQANWYKNS